MQDLENLEKEEDVQVSKVDNGQSPFIVEQINKTLEKASKMPIQRCYL